VEAVLNGQADIDHLQTGLAGGSRGPDPPATAGTTCEIRLNPMTFFMVRGWGWGSAITLFKTYILAYCSLSDVFNIRNSAA